MTRMSVAAATLLSLAIGMHAALAEDTAPAAAPKLSATDRAAISKSCTDQANAKGLHGKARRKFRAECKHKGGKFD
jgi:hypothetical protein